jgi:hypothetical protein
VTPSKEPVAWANIVAAIVALLSLAVAMGWISLTSEQFVEIERALGAVGVVLSPLIAAFWARRQVTPLAEPKDEDGSPLVRRADGGPTIKQTRSMLKE